MNIYEKSAHLKALMLQKGFKINDNALGGLGTEFKEEHRGYDDSNWGIKEDAVMPSEVVLPGEIIVGTHVRQDSPYEIKNEDGKLYLFEGEEKLSKIKYLPRPKIWGKKLKNGTDVKKIANIYGFDVLNINIYSGCEFWDAGMPCKFCSVSPTQKRFCDGIIKKTPAQIREATAAAFSSGDKIKYALTTGGSTRDPNTEIDTHVEALNVIKEFTPWGDKIKGNTALMPPLDLKKLDSLYETGITHPSFNLEVWGKDKFVEICPGKDKYRGFDNILKAYKYMVKNLYGEGEVWCNFVGGINTLSELKQGFRKMADMGVVPGANVFHPDVGAILGKTLKTPSYEYITEMYRCAADIYHEKGFKPFFIDSLLRNSLANESYRGWI